MRKIDTDRDQQQRRDENRARRENLARERVHEIAGEATKRERIEQAGRYIRLESSLNRYGDGTTVKNANLKIEGTLTRVAISYVGTGFEGRQESGEPMVPGPWASTFGLGSMLTAGRVAREPEITVADGDVLSIDGVDFRVRVYRREYVALDRIEDDGSLTPAGWRF